MKDSRIEWIGDVPDNWKMMKLKYVVVKEPDSIKPGPFGSDLKNADLTDKGYRVYNQKDVLQQNFAQGDEFVNDAKFSSLHSFKVKPGDILLTSRGTIGKSIIVPSDSPQGIIHPCLIRLRFDRSIILNSYAQMIMNDTDFFKQNVSYNSNATVIAVIYATTLREIKIPLPSTDEQYIILEFLGTEIPKINADIQKNKKLIELLKEKRQAIINQAVTKGLDPTVPMKDSGIEWIDKIPKHWGRNRLSRVSSVIDPHPSHRNPPYVENGIPFVGIGDLDENGNIINVSHTVGKEVLHEQKQRFSIENGDMGLGRVATIGKIIKLKSDQQYCISGRMAIIRPKIFPNYLFYYLQSYYFQKQIEKELEGTTFGVLGIQLLRKLEIFLPPIDEQKHISHFLTEKINEVVLIIAKTECLIEKLQEFRQSLISSAFTGKIDMRETQTIIR